MENFRRVIHDCSLQEIPFTGPKFTWSRGKGSIMILEWLDKGLANEEWFNMFTKVNDTHLTSIYFDHTLILFYISRRSRQVGRTKNYFGLGICGCAILVVKLSLKKAGRVTKSQVLKIWLQKLNTRVNC